MSEGRPGRPLGVGEGGVETCVGGLLDILRLWLLLVSLATYQTILVVKPALCQRGGLR